MDTETYEKVYTITDYYDGIRSGIADFRGVPHYYECPLNDNHQGYADYFLLRPIDEETFNLALEDWDIWGRWFESLQAHETTQETHPALPQDRERHNMIKSVLSEQLVVDYDRDLRAQANFRPISGGYAGSPTGTFEVNWRVISDGST